MAGDADWTSSIELISRESAPLGVFGRVASAAVRRRLTDAGISMRMGTSPTEYADGRLWLELEEPLDVDLVIALPHLRGPELSGLPQESGGSCRWTRTDAFAGPTVSGPWAT